MSGKHNDLVDFITHVKSVGLPSASHYQVTLPNLGRIDSRKIMLVCDTVDMPGVNIMTQELRTMGEPSEIPYGISYMPVNMTFIVDNNFNAKAYFAEWMNLVYNKRTRTVGYYDDYAKSKTVTIEALDKKGNIIWSVKLLEVYPKAVDSINFNNSNHETLKLNVQFAYKFATEDLALVSGTLTTPRRTIPELESSENVGIETLSTSPKDRSFNFGSRDDKFNFGAKLSKFGPSMGTEINRSCKAVESSSLGVTLPGEPTFGAKFGSAVSSVGNSVATVGSIIGDIGKTINNAAAPLTAIGGAVSSLSNTVGALDSVMKSVGINSGLGSVTKDLRKISGTMGAATKKIGSFTGPLGSLGGSMGALGGSMSTISKSFETMAGVPDQLKKSTAKLGQLFSKKGDETVEAAGEIRTQVDNGSILNA
jgi:hypothetical protein